MNKNVFISYFKGDLSKDQEKELIDWIEEREENREEFLQERKLWELLLLNAPLKEPYDQRDTSLSLEPRSKFRSLFIQTARIAAILLLAFSLGFWFKSNQNSKIAAIKTNTIEVPTGQRVLLTLGDGTKVWLNAKSKFSFPDHFDQDNRTVELDGEALFDVIHNEKAPFLVNTPKYQVKVLGTQFDVYAYKNSTTFETTLIRGKVVLKANHSDQNYELRPDEQFVEDTMTHKSEIHKVFTQEYTTWIDGVYSFNDQSFSSIVQRLERYYEAKIVVNDPELMNYRFTGKFRYGDPLTVILDVVKQSKHFTYKQIGNNVIINK